MKRPALILICLPLWACSAMTKELGNSLWDSPFGTPGTQLTDGDIQNMFCAGQYMQLNDEPQLSVMPVFTEGGQQEWVAQDQIALVTQYGRPVEALFGDDSLIRVNNPAINPLIKSVQIIDGTTWARTMGRTEYQQVYHTAACSAPKWDGTNTVEVDNNETPVCVLDGEVSTDQVCWRSHYWIDSERQVRQLEQYLGADYFPVKTAPIRAARQ